jgi:hypothetical protein
VGVKQGGGNDLDQQVAEMNADPSVIEREGFRSTPD